MSLSPNPGCGNRETGIDLIGSIPWGTHLCQFYQAVGDLLETHTRYFKAGLENNEACIWVLPDCLSPEDVEAAFRNVMPDFGAYLYRDQIQFISARRWYLRDGVFNLNGLMEAWREKLTTALSSGYSGLRVSGDGSWYKEMDWQDVCAYEKAVCPAIAGSPVLSLCTYPMSEFTPDQITEMISYHQLGLITRDGSAELIETSNGRRTGPPLGGNQYIASGILDLAPCHLVVIGRDGRVVYANQTCADVFGCSSADMEGRYLWDLAVYRNSRELVRAFCEQCITSRFCIKSEHRWELPDGSYKYLSWSAMAAPDSDGGAEYIVAVGTDITERKQNEDQLRENEERYRAIVDAYEGLVHSVTRDHRIEFMNQRLIERTGYDATGEFCYKVLHDRDSVCPWCVNERVFAGETVRREEQSPKDGRWYQILDTPIRRSDGVIVKHSMMQDITEQKLTEEALRKAYERDRMIAETLQKAILPSIDISVDGFGIAGKYQPALKQAEVGGDFYDLFKLPDGRTGFVIGDVSGKGVQAAVHTAMAKYMLRAYADKNPDPAHVLNELNGAICDYTPDEIFITIIFAALDPSTRLITYANAGHDKPLLYRFGANTVTSLDTTGGLLGVARKSAYDSRTIELSPGDFLLMYTDGITDAKCRGDFFDIEGLSHILVANAAHGEERIVDAVYEAALAFAEGDLGDDAAVLVLRASPDGQ